MQIRTFQDLPAWEPVVHTVAGIQPQSSGEVLRWGTRDLATPPAVGDIIHCRVNGIGECRVLGYFHDGGYLGVAVRVLHPPLWFIKQNGEERRAFLFGNEVCTPAQWVAHQAAHKAKQAALEASKGVTQHG